MRVFIFTTSIFIITALISAEDRAKVQCPVIVFDSRTLFTGFGHYNFRPWKHLHIAPFITFQKYQKVVLVGQEAFKEAHSNLPGSFYINDIKKLIGKSFKNSEVQSVLASLPKNVAFEKKGRAHFKFTYGGKEEEFDSESILGIYLARLRDAYQKEESKKVKKKEFIQTVYFISTMALKEAEKGIDGYTQAFLNGGYKLSRVIEEPIAVVKGTGLQRVADNFLTILLYGQSFEIAVVRRTDEQSLTIIGRLIEKDLVGPKYCEEAHWDEINANRSTGFLIQNANDAFFNDAETTKIHHHEFESMELAREYSKTVLNAIQNILKTVNLKRENVDHIIISGDLPRGIYLRNHRPIVRETHEKVEKYFERTRAQIFLGYDTLAANGAMLEAWDKCKPSHIFPVPANGWDMVKLSLGVESANGIMSEIVPRYTFYPLRVTRTYRILNKNRFKVSLHAGERAIARYNYILGTFEVVALNPELLSEDPTIEITIRMNNDENIHVIAEFLDYAGKIEIIPENNNVMVLESHTVVVRMGMSNLHQHCQESKRWSDHNWKHDLKDLDSIQDYQYLDEFEDRPCCEDPKYIKRIWPRKSMQGVLDNKLKNPYSHRYDEL